MAKKSKKHTPKDAYSEVINRRYENPPDLTIWEEIGFTRVVRLDLCPCDDNLDLKVVRIDLDYSRVRPKHVAIDMAKRSFQDLLKPHVSLCEDPPSAADIFKNIGIGDDIQTQTEGFTYRNFLEQLRLNLQNPELSGNIFASGDPKVHEKKLNPDTFDNFNQNLFSLADGVTPSFENYYPFPSSFDLKFNGPTAVIYRSNVKHFRFMPRPFIFTNPRDEMYYRNQDCDMEYRQCHFVNAWDSGYSTNRLPFKSPINQEHKIDLAMVLCMEGVDLDGSATILTTPIRIDPPLNNGGGD